MTAADGTDDETLLAEAVLALEQRGEAGLQELLAQHPTRAAGVRVGLEQLRRLGVLAPPPAAFEAEWFGEFRVLRRLGAGGMGVVYLAEQPSLQRQVALKVVRPELLLSPTARERFQREVEAVARLQHPGIVPILAVGERQGQPWFAMEYLPGRTLEQVSDDARGRDLVRASGASLRELIGATGSGVSGAFAGAWWEACARLLLQIAQTLVHVHERGIVHRDLKPSNVIVLPHGQPMLLDFGLAHVQDLARVTREHAPVGSPAYMAPEQVRGEAVDERVDVYGLAVTGYQLLTGAPAFPHGEPERLRSAILAGEVRPLRAGNRGLPRDLEIVMSVAMDRDRARRYGTMAAFAADLENVLLRRPIRARPLGRALRGLRFAQRHPAFAATTAAVLLLVLQFPLVLWRLQADVSARLERTNGELQQALVERDRANGELARAGAATESERQRAQRAFEEALVTLREMLVRVGQSDLMATPGSEPLRLSILQRADELFGRLAHVQPGDPRLELDAARTQQYLGNLWITTGQRERGEARLREAIVRAGALADAEGELVVGVAGKLLGQSLLGRDLTAALAALEAARCALERACLRLPDEAEPVRQHAEVLNSLGLVQRDAGRAELGFELLERAQRMKTALVDAAPGDVRAVLAWAIGCINLAPMLAARGRAAEAADQVDAAIARMLDLRPAAVDSRLYRERLAFLFDRRGSRHQDGKDHAAARTDHGIAFALRRELLAEFPTTAAYHNQVGASLRNLAMTVGAAGDQVAALDFDTESVARQRDALARAPGTRQYLVHLEYALVGRASALLALRRLDELASAIGELAEQSVTAEGALNAARLFVRLGTLLAERDGATAAATVETLRERGVASIGVAIDRGFRDAAHFTTGPLARWYEPLRARADYAAVLARLGGR